MAACSQAEVVKSWEKPLAPGMTFRMEVEANPARTIYGIKYDPKLVRAESWLAGRKIYQPGQFNGRSVVSEMVKEAGAQAGINGDFFQWTPDPGGDPQGFMVSKGVLISAQGKGQRTAAYAWGPGTAGQVVEPKAVVTVSGLTGEMEVTTLNGKVAEGGLGLSFDLAGEIYGHAPLTVVHLDLAGTKLGLNGEMKATVKRVESAATRPAIAPGTAVLAGAGDWAAQLMAMPVGSSLTIKISIAHLGEGLTEAMGGGPVLLKGGAYAGPVENADAPRHPRTAMGSTADGKVWSIVIDGRQTMSVGTTFTETAEVMKRWGCVEAVNLDGGGSSTLHALGITLNRPSSGGIERPVANGVVLFSDVPRTERLEGLIMELPKTMKIGESASAKLMHNGASLADSSVIWTCQGAAWVDQEGRLVGHAKGIAAVRALVKGSIVEGSVTVTE